MKKRYIILIVLLVVLVLACFAAAKAFHKDENGKMHFFRSAKTYKEYKQGDIIDFHDSEWYVMYDSSNKDEYVTLISSDVLYLADEEITDVVMGIYETSDINKYLKGEYARELGSSNLDDINGYTVRLFNQDDFENLLKVKYNSSDDSYEIEKCPDFICLTNTFYATMVDTKDIEFLDRDVYETIDDFNEDEDSELHLKYYNLVGTYETCRLESVVDDATLFVRPVINLKKEAIE